MMRSQTGGIILHFHSNYNVPNSWYCFVGLGVTPATYSQPESLGLFYFWNS